MHKKYTPSGNFSPKRGNKNFYKGKGGNKYGKSDKHGNFQLRPQGKPDWSIPDLADFKLKPYVQLTVRTDATPEPPPILVGRKGQPPIYPHPGGGPFVPRAAVEAATTGADPSGAAAVSAEGGDR
eukprot:Transcript_8617.p2 GENE.Transcript_8617~~Transcript_8617.p2  ORF type:complete len:125 (-),score=32.15 Transcript_8617:252-626(-)